MDPALALEVAALSQMKAMHDATALGGSDIQRFYDNSTVFLTGGSGFLGKQLIEKLLRSCNLSKVYILMRSKKGKDIQERLKEVLLESAFDTLRKQKPDFSDKMVAVEGDVAEIRLGLSTEDWNTLTKEVNVIFHVAATTRFDETLRLATLINVRGTRECLILGKACRKLKSYVHVSTAYTHTTVPSIGKQIEETFYKTPVPPNDMISLVENVDEDRILRITPELIKDWPNTYTFTKSIAEFLVQDMSEGLPICIVRPGIVVPSYREPSPGWLDISNINGASGFIFGLGLGVLHTALTNFDNKLGIIPCDYVNNLMIAAAREAASTQTKGGVNTKIYTSTSTCRNPITWRYLKEWLQADGPSIATPSAVYYAYAHDTSNKLIFMLLTLFLHIIPAYIADFVCLLLGKERRFVRLAKKTYNLGSLLSYFTTNEWLFVDHNSAKLQDSLSEQDRTIFNFDVTDINWHEFIVIWCLGIRKYVIKDGLKNTKYAVKKQKVLRIVHYVFMALYIYGIWKIFSCLFYVVRSIFLPMVILLQYTTII